MILPVYPAFPVGNSQEQGNDSRSDQFQIVGVQAKLQHDLQDKVINDGAEGYGKELQGEVDEELSENDFTDNDGGKADDDAAPAHIDVGRALVLG